MKYAVLAGIIIVILVTGLFGAHFGYTVNGVPQGADVPEGTPGIIVLVTYVFEGVGFLLSMVAFRIDNMPVFMGAIFLFMGLMSLMLALSLIRGTE